MAAVAAVQASHPGLLVAEAGDASTDAAGNALLASDFGKAEVTSVPITLILLLAVFGALVAAGIPLVLAGAAGPRRSRGSPYRAGGCPLARAPLRWC